MECKPENSRVVVIPWDLPAQVDAALYLSQQCYLYVNRQHSRHVPESIINWLSQDLEDPVRIFFRNEFFQKTGVVGCERSHSQAQ